MVNAGSRIRVRLFSGKTASKHSLADSTAFNIAWEKERPRIWRALARLIGDVDVADDLTQEVGLLALRNAATFRGEAQFSTWLYRVAVNVALRHREKTGKVATTALEETIRANPDDSPESRLEVADRTPKVQAALNSLPDDLRTPLVLHIYEELKYREIAAVLEIPLGTVMSRLHTARQRMKVALRKELDDDTL